MPWCPEIYPWFYGHESDWACQPPGNQPSQWLNAGCGLCCKNYPMDSGGFRGDVLGASATGTRFLRPSNLFESRDAHGKYTYIEAGRPVRLPRISSHQIAMCWRPGEYGSAQEFWTLSICACKFICAPGPGCRPVASVVMTCNWFVGHGNRPTMECTGVTLGDVPGTITFIRGVVNQAAFATTGRWNHTAGVPIGGGSSNILNLCLSEILACHPGCELWHAEDIWPEQQTHFSPNWTIWELLYIHEFLGEMYVDDDCPDPEHETIAGLKNEALDWLRRDIAAGIDGVTHLGHLDLVPGSVDHWQRDWNTMPGEGFVPIEDMPAVATWSDCALRFSGHAVIVEWVVNSVTIEASIVMYRKRTLDLCEGWWADDPEDSRKVYNARASIRVRVEMRMALRARFADAAPHRLIRDWLSEEDPRRVVNLRIDNREAERVPRVIDDNGHAVDHIRYILDDDTELDHGPPMRVEWYGEMGPFDEGGWGDVFQHEYYIPFPSSIYYECCALARGMSNVTVRALESEPEAPAGERHRIYDGSVRIGVNHRTGNLCPA